MVFAEPTAEKKENHAVLPHLCGGEQLLSKSNLAQVKSKRKRLGLSGCSELQKPKMSLKAEILLSGAETKLTIRGSLTRELAAAVRGRANAHSVCIRLVQSIPKCHFSDVVCMIRTRKSRIFKKKIFHFSQCVQVYPLLSLGGHPLIQPTKPRENIPAIITDICMGQNPLAWH